MRNGNIKFYLIKVTEKNKKKGKEKHFSAAKRKQKDEKQHYNEAFQSIRIKHKGKRTKALQTKNKSTENKKSPNRKQGGEGTP